MAEIGVAVLKINHDLRNLLAAAMLHAERLEASSDPSTRRAATNIVGALDRATDYVEQTLAYARDGSTATVRRTFELGPMIEELASLAGLDGAGPISWTVDVPPGLTIEADPSSLFRALLNLVRNAVQAVEDSSGERRVTVSARRLWDIVRIEVRDTGPGLPPEIRDRLFEPFQTTRPRGTGLGLAVVAEIIRAHGGDVRLLPTDTGAVFALDLPDLDPRESTPSLAPMADAA